MNRPGPFPLNASEWEVEKRGWLHKSSEESQGPLQRCEGSYEKWRRPSVEGHDNNTWD